MIKLLRILLAGALCAWIVLTPGMPFVDEGEEPSAAQQELDALGWLAGHWRVERGEAMTEELWLPPRGGTMLGLNRSLRGDRPAAFEFLRLVATEDGVVYLASPGGAEPTPFRLTEVERGHAVFENPEHDFPKVIEYRLEGDALTASIAGDTPGPSWAFRRVGKVE